VVLATAAVAVFFITVLVLLIAGDLPYWHLSRLLQGPGVLSRVQSVLSRVQSVLSRVQSVLQRAQVAEQPHQLACTHCAQAVPVFAVHEEEHSNVSAQGLGTPSMYKWMNRGGYRKLRKKMRVHRLFPYPPTSSLVFDPQMLTS